MNPIETAYRAGQVTRYHTISPVNMLNQTTADHSANMISLLFMLHDNPSQPLVKAIVFHDGPEYFGGDLCYTFKKENPVIAAEYEKMSLEMSAKAGMPVTSLNKKDASWLEFLDRLECLFLIKIYFPHLLVEEDWVKLRHYVIDMAYDLGVYHKIQDVFEDERKMNDGASVTVLEKDASEKQLRIDTMRMVLSDKKLVSELGFRVTGNSAIGSEVMRNIIGDLVEDLELELTQVPEEMEPDGLFEEMPFVVATSDTLRYDPLIFDLRSKLREGSQKHRNTAG